MKLFHRIFGKQVEDAPQVKVPCGDCGAMILLATAKKTGGICMVCKREGPPAQSKFVQRAYLKPARCLSAFGKKTSGDAVQEGNVRDQLVKFQLECNCGAAIFKVHGFPLPGRTYPSEDSIAGPISLECHVCKRINQVFNPEVHGYNGELDSLHGMESAGKIDSAEPLVFQCSKCEEMKQSIAVSLIYSIPDEEMDGDVELAQRPQDFFTTFSLYGRCMTCEYVSMVTDYECA